MGSTNHLFSSCQYSADFEGVNNESTPWLIELGKFSEWRKWQPKRIISNREKKKKKGILQKWIKEYDLPVALKSCIRIILANSFPLWWNWSHFFITKTFRRRPHTLSHHIQEKSEDGVGWKVMNNCIKVIWTEKSNRDDPFCAWFFWLLFFCNLSWISSNLKVSSLYKCLAVVPKECNSFFTLPLENAKTIRNECNRNLLIKIINYLYQDFQ